MKYLCFFLTLALCQSAQASFVLQLGGYWASKGQSQIIPIDDLLGNTYTTNNTNPSNGLVGLGLYFDGYQASNVILQYGINGYYLGPTDITGQIMVEQNFTNFNYSYSIQHAPIYLAAKALLTNFNISIDAGIGPNFVRVSNYQEKPLNSFSVAQANFTSNNATVFTVMAGFGLRIPNIFGPVPFEIGYRFFYLGQNQLQINNNLYQNALNTGTMYANALFCSIIV